jgi:acyl carrier protein
VEISTLQKSNRIIAIVGGLIKDIGDIERNADLRELGLTSMQMVNLMLSIEAEFDLTIPSNKLVPSNFRTIENIEALLSELSH